MPKWLRTRLQLAFFVILAAIAINFAIPRLMPGDITDIYVEEVFMDEATQHLIRDRFGLDQSLWTQFWLYLKNTFTGNFGYSFYYYPRTVSSLIAENLPRSLAIVLPAQFIYVIIGYFLGTKAGYQAGSKTDTFITGSSMVAFAAPMFWVAMIMLMVGGFTLGWFPLRGYYTIGMEYPTFFHRIADWARYAFLPILTLVICRFGSSVFVMRNTITITLKENYITSARAKGLSERRVKHRHAARNALLPLVTSTSFGVAMSVSGSVFIEKVFSYPGIGNLIFTAVGQRDFPVIQACFLISAILVIAIVVLLDVIYARLDQESDIEEREPNHDKRIQCPKK